MENTITKDKTEYWVAWVDHQGFHNHQFKRKCDAARWLLALDYTNTTRAYLYVLGPRA